MSQSRRRGGQNRPKIIDDQENINYLNNRGNSPQSDNIEYWNFNIFKAFNYDINYSLNTSKNEEIKNNLFLFENILTQLYKL